MHLDTKYGGIANPLIYAKKLFCKRKFIECEDKK